MHKLNAFPILSVALGALLCAAGIGLLYKADTLTLRLMRATGADVLSGDPTYPPESFPAPGAAEQAVHRAARWSLPVHAVGLFLIALGAWLQVRALRRREQPSLDDHTQCLLAEWVLMRARLQRRSAAGWAPSSLHAPVLKVLDYLIARYSVPGPARTRAMPSGRTHAVTVHAPASFSLRRFHGARRQPKGSATFRPALEEIRRLNVDSYAGFGFSQQLRRSADYN